MAPEAREQMLARAAENLPAKRYGRAEDLAKGYLFVMDNPFVTGSIVDIEGGLCRSHDHRRTARPGGSRRAVGGRLRRGPSAADRLVADGLNPRSGWQLVTSAPG